MGADLEGRASTLRNRATTTYTTVALISALLAAVSYAACAFFYPLRVCYPKDLLRPPFWQTTLHPPMQMLFWLPLLRQRLSQRSMGDGSMATSL